MTLSIFDADRVSGVFPMMRIPKFTVCGTLRSGERVDGSASKMDAGTALVHIGKWCESHTILFSAQMQRAFLVLLVLFVVFSLAIGRRLPPTVPRAFSSVSYCSHDETLSFVFKIGPVF